MYVEHGCGWVDAPLFTETLLAAASGRGAVVRERTRVAAIGQDEGHVTGVTAEAGEQIPADTVVNAAGSWASHIGALAGCQVPVDLRPGLIVYSQPLFSAHLRSVLNTPLMNIRPHHDGSVAIHARAESMYEPHHWNALDPADAIQAAARWLPGLGGTTPRASRVGIRPVPPGGPIIGPHPYLDGFYIAVSHGGVAWSPQWGSFAASEINGTPVSELDQWWPTRFPAGPVRINVKEHNMPTGENANGH